MCLIGTHFCRQALEAFKTFLAVNKSVGASGDCEFVLSTVLKSTFHRMQYWMNKCFIVIWRTKHFWAMCEKFKDFNVARAQRWRRCGARGPLPESRCTSSLCNTGSEMCRNGPEMSRWRILRQRTSLTTYSAFDLYATWSRLRANGGVKRLSSWCQTSHSASRSAPYRFHSAPRSAPYRFLHALQNGPTTNHYLSS